LCDVDTAESTAGADGYGGGRAAERSRGRVAVAGADSPAAVASARTRGGIGGHAAQRVGIFSAETGHGLLLVVVSPSHLYVAVFTVRCSASVVYAVVVCLCVCLYVCYTSVLYQKKPKRRRTHNLECRLVTCSAIWSILHEAVSRGPSALAVGKNVSDTTYSLWIGNVKS